jgi:hypothetical protein
MLLTVRNRDSENGFIPGSSTAKLAWASASELNSYMAEKQNLSEGTQSFSWYLVVVPRDWETNSLCN